MDRPTDHARAQNSGVSEHTPHSGIPDLAYPSYGSVNVLGYYCQYCTPVRSRPDPHAAGAKQNQTILNHALRTALSLLALNEDIVRKEPSS